MIRLEPRLPRSPGEPGAEAGDDEGRRTGAAHPALRRRIAWGVGLAVLLIVATFATAIALRVSGGRALDRAAERFREVVGPLDAEAYRPAPVPDAENAALPILETFERLKSDDELDISRALSGFRPDLRLPASAWSEETWRRARTLEGSTRAALAPLDDLSGRAGSDFGLEYADGLAMELPNLRGALDVTALLHARTRLAWRDGRVADRVEAVEAVEALSVLSRALEGEALLLFQLVGHDVERTQYRAVQDLLAAGPAGPLDRATLDRLRAAAGEHPRAEALRRTLGAAASNLYGLRPGEHHGRATGFKGFGLERLLYRLLGARAIADGLDYYARVVETYVPATAAEGGHLPAPPSTRGTALPVPDLGLSIQTLRATESLRRLALLALDLASEGIERGALPEALPEPTAADPFTGTTPLYARAPDGSATLSLPEAEELLLAARPGRIRRDEETPLFTWTLRAVGTAPGDPDG